MVIFFFFFFKDIFYFCPNFLTLKMETYSGQTVLMLNLWTSSKLTRDLEWCLDTGSSDLAWILARWYREKAHVMYEEIWRRGAIISPYSELVRLQSKSVDRVQCWSPLFKRTWRNWSDCRDKKQQWLKSWKVVPGWKMKRFLMSLEGKTNVGHDSERFL